jgi:ABC-type nickel/cobalt efflux system permease component RcnA
MRKPDPIYFYMLVIWLWCVYLLMIFIGEVLPAAHYVQIASAAIIIVLYIWRFTIGYKPRHPHDTRHTRAQRQQFKKQAQTQGHTKSCWQWMKAAPGQRSCVCEVGQKVVPDDY